MNKRQKLVQEAFLNNEEAVIKQLKQVYNQSLKDINGKAQQLQNQINNIQDILGYTTDTKEKERLLSMRQSKVYQKQYQDALRNQIESILDNMQVEEFKTVSDYLQKCYEDGFIGTIYDLQGQGIPLCFPLDQEAMVRAVQTDSKISEGLYTRLGEDVAVLKKKIAAEVSRGISTGMSFAQVAKQLATYTNIGFNNAVRIARTEGHRIQVQSAMDACHKAAENGADVVKQWDSTLDSRTRPSHQRVDGEIRELDEKFSNGLMYPGDPSGGAAEVVNCRCALLQRARWALNDDELETLKERVEFFGLDKTEDFENFKKRYLKAAEDGFKEYKVIGNRLNLSQRANVWKTVDEMPQKVQEVLKKATFNIDSARGSGFDVKTNIIHLAENAPKNQIAHEIGHFIESLLFDKQEVDDLKRKLVSGLVASDVKKVRATNGNGDVSEVYILKSDNFINGYQSRIYANSYEECFDANGNIDIDKMEEIVSVAFEYYMSYNRTMRKYFPDMYRLVRKAVGK